ncbi:MAG: SpoIID/LytB domain-containing protein, partial [Clostridia bacterium]|nr:SpoIID/LytB domain-containing protein [Clostridia bacterium]
TLIIFILTRFTTLFVYADTYGIDVDIEMEDVAENTEDDTYYVDIGLFYGSSAKSSVTVKNDEGTFTVNASDVSDSVTYNSDGVISVDGTKYRGSIILKKDSSGLLTVINHVDLEDYIASVIAVEMSPSFNIEALKAQAVCARTYALKNMNKHSSRGFDLCASVDCQAYKGVSVESETTNRAARETAGVVMKYNGQIIDAVYSATSGGYTEDVKYVWGSNIPYLKAVEDKYESKSVYGSSWEKELSVEKATEIMNNKGYELGTITNIEVTESTEHGTATKLVVTGTEGEKIFTKEGCRLAFGTVTLSQAFTVTAKSSETKAEPLYTCDGKKISGNVTVVTGKGTKKINLKGVTLLGNTKKDYAGSVNGPVTGFVFTGRGYGHLVGMSQNGANGMAGAGFSYEEILKHYYKGIELTWI